MNTTEINYAAIIERLRRPNGDITALLTDAADAIEQLLLYRNSVTGIDCQRIADHLLDNGVTVQGWIPVSFQKPEESKEVKFYNEGPVSFATVLVCGGNRGVNRANRLYIKDGYLATDGWVWSTGNEDVTHWQPLPEPPKEEK